MKLGEWRAREGLSLEETGERLGFSHATISRLERGKNLPDTDTIQKIFEKTSGAVTLHDWFTADGKPKQQKAREDEDERDSAA